MPNGKVILAAVSCVNRNIINALENLNIEILKIPPYKNNKSNPEAAHADMQFLHLGENRIVILDHSVILDLDFRKHSFDIAVVSSDIYEFKYPQCIKLNCAVIGDNVIGNFKYIDRKVKDLLSNKKFLNVNQGYAKCSVAIVSENAIITSDNCIYSVAIDNKIDCLKISEGNIYLCEKYYGFIGGTCFKLDKNILAFTGKIEAHPDYKNIKAFCKNYRVELLSLTDKQLTDIGGIIPLKETDC